MWVRNRHVFLTIVFKSSEDASFALSDIDGDRYTISHTKNGMIHTVTFNFKFTPKIILDCSETFEIQSISLMRIPILKDLIPKVATIDNNRIIFNFFNNDPIKYLMFIGNNIRI